MAAESFVLSIDVVLADRLRRTQRASAPRAWIERIGGAILLAIAASIAREPVAPAP